MLIICADITNDALRTNILTQLIFLNIYFYLPPWYRFLIFLLYSSGDWSFAAADPGQRRRASVSELSCIHGQGPGQGDGRTIGELFLDS